MTKEDIAMFVNQRIQLMQVDGTTFYGTLMDVSDSCVEVLNDDSVIIVVTYNEIFSVELA